MAESGVILPVDSTGKALRSETVTTAFTTGSGGVVHQQVITLADSAGNLLGTTAAALPVTMAASGGQTPVAGSITAAGTNTPGTASTGSSTGQVVVNASIAGNATFHIVTSAFVGTLIFEGSVDAGLNYGPLMAIREDGTGSESSTAISTAAAFIRQYTVALPGINYFRVRASAFTSGSAAIVIAPGPTLVEHSPSLSASASSIGTVQQAALAKGTQGATGVSTQDLKDAGRALVSYYTVIPVLTSATDTLQSLTGTKGGATVTATATPAVVTTGKTFRVQKLLAGYVSTATSGYAMVRLRYNTGGVVTITSPVMCSAAVGNPTPGTANAVGMVEIPIPDGLEFTAGTGVGISVQGFAAVTATAVGYCSVTLIGYEY